LVADIQAWCTTLATNAFAELGYDGFGWNSLHKSKIPDLAARFKVQLASLADYVLGETDAGRALFCVVIEFPGGRGYPVTARDMTAKERRRYAAWKRRR
jgi:hypothetical protein